MRDRESSKWFTCRATSDEEAGEWFDTIRQEMLNPGFVKNQMTLHLESHPEEIEEGGPLLYFPSVLVNFEEAELSSEFCWGFDAALPSSRRRASSRLQAGFRYSQDLQQNVFRPLHLSSLLYYVLCDLLRIRERHRIR